MHSDAANDDGLLTAPWKPGGRDGDGADCVGIVLMWARQNGFSLDLPVTPDHAAATAALDALVGGPINQRRGEVVFLRYVPTGEIAHVAVCLDEERVLHGTMGGVRIDRGFTLLRRRGFVPAGSCFIGDADRAVAALGLQSLADVATIIGIIITVVSTIASYLIAPSTKLPKFADSTGRYSGFDGLFTQNSPEVPLADLLGLAVTAGNSPYQQLLDGDETITDQTTQRAVKVVVLGSGPFLDFGSFRGDVQINGLTYTDGYFFRGGGDFGFAVNPAQTKAEAIDGTIGGQSNRPSFTNYHGDYDITVPVDVRAQWVRSMPIYGFTGCAYQVFRLIDSTKFSSFNVTCRVKGRLCRTFDISGFIRTTVTSESLAGADGTKVRFKLASWDIESVSAVVVNGTSFAEISATAQTGNVFQINRLKGFIEFLAAPAAAATITCTYTYFPRAWTENNAIHAVYLLTEKVRGKGFDESRVDWDAAVALRDYCDAVVTWRNTNGTFSGARFRCDYVIDARKGFQEHMKAILDACYSNLFVSNGKFKLKARKSESAVFDFNERNIIKDSFRTGFVNRDQRSNRVKLVFYADSNLDAQSQVARDDYNDQLSRSARAGNDGVAEDALQMLAVVDTIIAERLAETMLTEDVNRRQVCSLITNIQGLPLEPLDVVTVTHSSRPSWAAKLMRIESIEHDDLDRMVLTLSEYVEF